MKLVVCAVGTRMPAWVDAGSTISPGACHANCRWRWLKSAPSRATASRSMPCWRPRNRAFAPRCRSAPGVVALDERGNDSTTRDLAARLEHWQTEGDDVAFVIGGPDGLAAGIRRDAHESLRLSSLTLPHALVRVVLAEALYRAWSVTRHHPYHRE